MPNSDPDLRDKSSRGNASQFFIAGELCRRGYSAVVTHRPFEYYIIPSEVMAKNVSEAHGLWLSTPGKKGQSHKDNSVRTVHQIFQRLGYFIVSRQMGFDRSGSQR